MSGGRRIMLCATCESDDVVRDAWAAWNNHSQQWVLSSVSDDAFCNACETETRLIEKELPAGAP